MYYPSNAYQDEYDYNRSHRNYPASNSNHQNGNQMPYEQEPMVSSFDQEEPSTYYNAPPYQTDQYGNGHQYPPQQQQRPMPNLGYPFRPNSSMSISSTVSRSTALPNFEDQDLDTATPVARNVITLNNFQYQLDNDIGRLGVTITMLMMSRYPDLVSLSKLPNILVLF